MKLRVAVQTDPVAGEPRCGDWVGRVDADADLEDTRVAWLAVIDGLGHGEGAAQAADVARAQLAGIVRSTPLARPEDVLDQLNLSLRPTRGAAIGLVRLHGAQLCHAGVGNTRTLLWRQHKAQRLPSRYGIVGEAHDAPPGETPSWSSELALQPGDWILMFSDGLAEGLVPEPLPSTWCAHPESLCTHLMQRWRNPRDDAGVLAAYIEAP